MAHAGRGGNTSLRGMAGSVSSSVGLLLAAVFLGPILLFIKAREDRQKRGISRSRKDIFETIAIGAAVVMINAGLLLVI